MRTLPITIPTPALAEFCRRHRIRRLALFGSVLRSDFQDASDVDLLVEFQSGYVPGLSFFGMQEELSQMLGRRVDLNTAADLDRRFRDEVLRQAEVVYDETSR